MAFRDKPPYSYVENGIQRGFLLERTQRILDYAGIKASFVDLPPKRIFREIENNTEAICSFGWYKIPEREKYAKFSPPIHQDRPHVVLASARAAAGISQHGSLKTLLADAELRLAVVDGVSYGPELDEMIGHFAGTLDRSLISPIQVARKLALDRADFMFIDQEDLEYLMSSHPGLRSAGLVRFDYPDLPPGLKRYILCSRQVSDRTMARIGRAVTRVLRQK
jgi:uncharacterized protein (TIGR02285 family)